MCTIPVKWVQQEITKQYENHYDVKVLAAILNYSLLFSPLPKPTYGVVWVLLLLKTEKKNTSNIPGLLSV